MYEHEDFSKRYSPCNFSLEESKIDNFSKFYDDAVQKMVVEKKEDGAESSTSTSEHDNVMLLTRNNCVSDKNVLKALIKITGSQKNSGFVFHSLRSHEIYEFTSSGKLAVVTIY